MATPFPSQVRTLEHFRRLDRAFDLSEYGTGKSVAPILRLRDLIPRHRALVICPTGVVNKWVTKELPTWGDPRWQVAELLGTRKQRWRRFLSPHHVGVINYEGLLVLGRELVAPAPKYDVLVIDEPHRLKDPASLASKAVAALSQKAKFVYGLTGSPVLENPLDAFGVMRAVNPFLFGTDYYAWRDRFFVRKSVSEYAGARPVTRWEPRDGALETIKAALHAISIRHLRSDLPVRFPQLVMLPPITVALEPSVRRAYDQMENDFFVTMKNGETLHAVHAYPRLQKLCQLTHGYVRGAGGFISIEGNDTKAHALYSLVEQVREQGPGRRPVVVWCVRYQEMDLAAYALKRARLTTAEVSGRKTVQQNNETVALFNRGKIDSIVCHPKSVGEGIDLEATHSIRFGLSWSHLQYAQPIGRFVRASSRHRKVVAVDIVAEDTVDEDILLSLRRKKNLLREILRVGTMPRKAVVRLKHGGLSELTDSGPLDYEEESTEQEPSKATPREASVAQPATS